MIIFDFVTDIHDTGSSAYPLRLPRIQRDPKPLRMIQSKEKEKDLYHKV